mmetsp:Transcript_970/g.2367  ORF Transcript_970/g.2367 Transcript_970/m.2367 type:complete len:240 (-) Transcript_970:309-1028(-)
MKLDGHFDRGPVRLPHPPWCRRRESTLRRDGDQRRSVWEGDRDPVPREDCSDSLESGTVGAVEVKHVRCSPRDPVFGELLEVAREIDQLARRVRVRQRAILYRGAQVREEVREALQKLRGHVWRIRPQKCHLRKHVGVVDRMAREHVPALCKEVVSEEGEARAVREDDRAEVGMDWDHVRRHVIFFGLIVEKSLEAPPVRERHVSVVQQPFEDADDFTRRLVRLVHHQNPPLTARADEG